MSSTHEPSPTPPADHSDKPVSQTRATSNDGSGDELAVGTLFERRYEIVRSLGSGSWAHVYEAINVRIGRHVAIKVARRDVFDATQTERRFETEARAAALVISKHVVSVFDMGTLADGRPYMVMEHLVGEDLHAYLAQARGLSPTEVVSLILQVLRGLVDIHAAGILHCDIKPENLVLAAWPGAQPLVKIVDFGISRSETSASSVQEVSGTPAYMAPEQCQGRCDRRTDLYSTGVVLYEALTGQLPHEAEELEDLVPKIIGTDAPDICKVSPHIDAALGAIVAKALAREPEVRYRTAEEFEAALEGWLQEKEAAQRPIDAMTSAPPLAVPTERTTLVSFNNLNAAHNKRVWLLGIAAFGSLLALAGASIGRSEVHVRPDTSPLVSAAAGESTTVVRGSQEVTTPVATHPLAGASASASANPNATPAASAKLRWLPHPPSVPIAQPTTPTTPAPQANECDPPFYYEGRTKVFKPSCL